MSASVAIGEFSRLTHLTVKTLRHYHQQGLLVPYAVDGQSGYRRYSLDQVPAALLIGRLRALDMPLADVRRAVEYADSGSGTLSSPSTLGGWSVSSTGPGPSSPHCATY